MKKLIPKFKKKVDLDPKQLELKKKERDIESQERKLEYTKTFDTTVVAAFTFVAGLLWRDVADSIIASFLPRLEGLVGHTLTAVIVTAVIVVFVARRNLKIRKMEAKLKKAKEDFDKEKLVIESEKSNK